MKILLLGKNGQVGWELQRSLAPLGQLIALDRHSMDYCGDLTNLSGIKDTILKIRPSVIVNAAAYTAVDKAESETITADIINYNAVKVIAEAAQSLDALVVHYSTDYVFNGEGSLPWKESDSTDPINAYGNSKLLGEHAITGSGCKHLIFRTSWVYAAKGHNFIRVMLRLAKDREELGVVNDQFGAPTGAELIADVTALAINRPENVLSGIYHLAASGETTWYEYANYIFELAREKGFDIKVSPDKVMPISAQQFITPARRPTNSRLNCTKLTAQFSLNLPGWRLGVERALSEILEKSNA